MFNLLSELFSFGGELFASLISLIGLVLGFFMEFAMILHTEMPRLEGLLVGIMLAWVLSRRDKHPLLRAISAPLKMIIDILDLLWDQCLDMIKDTWEAASGFAMKVLGKAKSWAQKAWSTMMGGLGSLKNKLKKNTE